MAAAAVLGLFALGTGAAISAPVISREVVRAAQPVELQREYEKPAVKSAMREAAQIVEKSVSYEDPLSQIGYYIPGGRAFRAQSYQATVTGLLTRKGYSQYEAERIARGAQELYRAESAGEASGAVAASTLAEGLGASTAQFSFGRLASAGAKVSAKKAAVVIGGATGFAGLYEGASTALIRQAAPVTYGRQQFDVKAVAGEAALGGATAGLLGGAIGGLAVKGSKKASKALLGGAYVLDPYEPVGDIFGGKLAAKTGFRGVRVPIFTPTITPTPTPTPSIAPTPAETPAATPSTTPTTTPSPVPTPSTTQTTVPIITETPTITPTPTTTPSPTTTPAETPTETTSETPTTTPTPTPTTTTTPTPTATPIPRFPFAPILPPLLPPYGERGGNVLRKGRLLYYSEWAQAGQTFRRLL